MTWSAWLPSSWQNMPLRRCSAAIKRDCPTARPAPCAPCASCALFPACGSPPRTTGAGRAWSSLNRQAHRSTSMQYGTSREDPPLVWGRGARRGLRWRMWLDVRMPYVGRGLAGTGESRPRTDAGRAFGRPMLLARRWSPDEGFEQRLRRQCRRLVTS